MHTQLNGNCYSKGGKPHINTVCSIDNSLAHSDLLRALHARHYKYYLMFVIGCETGLRISDILKLRGNVKRTMRITETKTGKKRIITFSLDAWTSICHIRDKYNLKPRDYLIFSSDRKRNAPVSRVQCWRVLHALSKSLDIPNVGTHSMRKTFAMSEYKRTKDLCHVQRLLNHKYLSTTLLYLSDGDLSKVNIQF